MTSSEVEKYDKITPREHILLRPDTYIGHVESIQEIMWIFENDKIIKKEITYTPGFLKIFDEILINARDASVIDPSCNTIKIEYNIEEGYISILNNGDIGIPVAENPKYKTMVPSMIFGELLTSSNYDDNIERSTGGRNGLGSKCANIFSTKFIVEIDDNKRNLRFKQTWTDNMLKTTEPIITKLPSGTKNSVKITFYPDFEKFNITDLNNDHYSLFYKRVYDIAGTSNNKKLKLYFNNKELHITNFKSYIEIYYPDNTIYYDTIDRWSVGIIYNNNVNGEIISFVNGINTYRGGSHCNIVIDNIIKILINDYIKKKDKEFKISIATIKENFSFFINAIIINPSFSSQTKDTLTTKSDKFGSKYEPSQSFLTKLSKCGIINDMLNLSKFKESANLKKTDGKKQIKISGIPKLEDANKAGGKDANKCTLILTEGDSAKATAMSGITVIGRDYYGVFPLKGKLLNVRDATSTQLLNNEEIKNLKIIIGLKQNEDYSPIDKFNNLRYGHILLLTDSDVDGSHIKGLIMNMFHALWPSLVKYNNFVQSLYTPIIKATKKNKNVLEFYNLTDYNNWKDTPEAHSYNIKYYKGLGTSTSAEAKEYFTDINTKIINYSYNDELPEDNDAITLAFDKSRSNDRKTWLMNYDINNIIEYTQKEVSYSKFINYDLIHFSNEDLIRSIPSVIDGLKPSQRKILYGAFLRGLDKIEVKVAQLAGFVSDKAAYHHGEMSLNGAIIGMAQNFTGSNNINILKPNGQFGTKMRGGKDFASSRYIWTRFDDLTTIIFNPSDNPILNNQTDDGIPIEPEFYIPIIPMILINGTEGIGTGFSTKIPPYNPLDVINNIKNIINNKSFEKMNPWWQGFTGTIDKIDEYNYEIHGVWKIKGNKLIITELPVGEWSSNYKEFLEKLLEGNKDIKLDKPIKVPKSDKSIIDKPEKIKKTKKQIPFLSYTDNNTDTRVYFELIFIDGYLETTPDINKIYHLTKKYSITNMHLYSSNGTIKKYDTVENIINDYYEIRLEMYIKRKEHQLHILEYQLKLISFKVKFILMIINKEIDINNKKKSDIENILKENDFPELGKSFNDNTLSYDYLLSMPLYNLTKEKLDELRNNKDTKEAEYNELNNKNHIDIWLDELNLLEKMYTKWIKNKK